MCTNRSYDCDNPECVDMVYVNGESEELFALLKSNEGIIMGRCGS
jgi:hypothetical protein